MSKNKEYVRRNFPFIYSLFKKIGVAVIPNKPHEKIFKEKYTQNRWKCTETVSGPGSTEISTENLKNELKQLLIELKIKSILDAGCGEFNWMKNIIGCEIDYAGIDVVDELIRINVQKYYIANIKFFKKDITSDALPFAGLIICRDVLVHYSISDIKKALENFKASGSGYLLATTFNSLQKNEEIFTGGWRPLNLEISPFNFPPPQRRIFEKMDKDGKYFPDKHLALWNLQELNIK